MPAKTLGLAEFREIIRALPFKPETVSLNGIGEPLVNKDILPIIDSLAQDEIDCSFFTNGTLLTAEMREALLHRTNLVFVGISGDGATKTTFEKLRKGAHFETWKNNTSSFLAAAKKRRPVPIKTALSVVVSRDNVDETAELVRLAASLGFDSAHLSDVVPNDPISQSMALQPGQWRDEDRREIVQLGAALGVEVTVASLSKKNSHFNCLQPWEYIQISAEGDILPCCAIVGSDKARVMGNLRNQSFDEIWQGKELRTFRSEMAAGTNSLCNECPYY